MTEVYKTGFALSGGFIKGFAHLGAIQALYEHGIKPDIISGVSAGALAGVFLADGKQPAEILELFKKKEFGDFTRFTLRTRGGFMSLEQLHDFLYNNLSVRRIEDLSIPLVVTATNLDKGTPVHFRNGDIAPRIAASCCVPGLFTPVRIDEECFIDGGVFMNLPVSIIRNMCGRVVAVNVSPILNREYGNSVFKVLLRTYHLMSRSNSNIERHLADILIEPENLQDYSNRELDRAGEIFESGYTAARKVLDKIMVIR